MAGKAMYDETDKARLYVVLTANDGNVKRTARETGVPESTVRRFKKMFQEEGPPDTEVVQEEVDSFVGQVDRVRMKALDRIEQLIPTSEKLNELNNTFGILTDKIDRVRGIDKPRERSGELVTADIVRGAIAGFVEASKELSRQREAEIVEAEFSEQVSLPAGK